MRQEGFTIVEIIIGTALLATAMLVAVMTLTAITKLQNKGSSARAVQQNGRYALESIERDVRNAGSVCIRSGGSCVSSGSTLDLTSPLQNGGQIRYSYDNSTKQIQRSVCPTGGCPGNGPAANAVSISSQDVRIPIAPQFDYVGGARPFLKIHLEVEQKTPGLLPTDSFYEHYNLDTTVVTRQ